MSANINFFQLFDLVETYDMDETSLSSRYRDLQRTVHPDRFLNGTSQEKLLAVQRSGLINEAYTTLSNPLSRAEHLLACADAAPNPEMTGGDAEFLMRQIQWRESLDALNDTVATEHSQALQVLSDEIEEFWNKSTTSFAQAWQARALTQAQEAYFRMQFIAKMRQHINDFKVTTVT